MRKQTDILREVKNEGLDKESGSTIFQWLNPGSYNRIKVSDKLTPNRQKLFTNKYATPITDSTVNLSSTLRNLLRNPDKIGRLKTLTFEKIIQDPIIIKYGLINRDMYDLSGIEPMIRLNYRDSTYSNKQREYSEEDYAKAVSRFAADYYINNIRTFIRDRIAEWNPNVFTKKKRRVRYVKDEKY